MMQDSDPPPSSPEEKPSFPYLLFLIVGAAMIVGGVVVTSSIVVAVGTAVMGEPLNAVEMVGAAIYCFLGLAISWVGRRAARREEDDPDPDTPPVAYSAVVVNGLGLSLGISLGITLTSASLDAAQSLDRMTCSHFSGPLEPADPAACRAAARDCRREIEDVPDPFYGRGVVQSAPKVPEGLERPEDPTLRARVECVYLRRKEFLD